MNDIFSDVKRNIDRKNKLLFTRNSPSLQPLRDRMAIQPRRTLVMWALESARVPLLRLQDRYPEEERPRICLERCDEWAQELSRCRKQREPSWMRMPLPKK